MDLTKYKALTGTTVPASKEAMVTANIRRTKARLETLLGFTLKPKNLYTEKGKARFEGVLPIEDYTSLLPPDEEVGTYKLFDYNEKDKFFHVDPFTDVYRVKLVLPTTGGEFITIQELENVVPQFERDGIGKYIERNDDWFNWYWYRTWTFRDTWRDDSGGLQLAVEADWIDCYPDDLMYLWADMVEYRSDRSFGLASESVDGHSWSKTKESQTSPETVKENITLLRRYAGPYGSINRNPTR